MEYIATVFLKFSSKTEILWSFKIFLFFWRKVWRILLEFKKTIEDIHTYMIVYMLQLEIYNL